jgi:hypothetical protein
MRRDLSVGDHLQYANLPLRLPLRMTPDPLPLRLPLPRPLPSLLSLLQLDDLPHLFPGSQRDLEALV